MSVRRIIFVAIALFLTCSAFAQTETVRVRKAEGRWEVSNDITMAQAEEKALLEAKKEALRKAGIVENVWSVMGHISSSDGEKFSEAYSSVSTMTINGLVNVLEKKVDELWDQNLKRMFKIVTIDAEVVKSNIQEDLAYKLTVEGIETVYRHGDIFKCSFKIYGHDSYLKVFWFTNDEAAMIYPNEYEGNRLFKTGESYSIPVTEDIDLVMEKAKDVDAEYVNIIILATKKDYAYVDPMDFQSIMSWIYHIPADQRVIHHDATIIK